MERWPVNSHPRTALVPGARRPERAASPSRVMCPLGWFQSLRHSLSELLQTPPDGTLPGPGRPNRPAPGPPRTVGAPPGPRGSPGCCCSDPVLQVALGSHRAPALCRGATETARAARRAPGGAVTCPSGGSKRRLHPLDVCRYHVWF